MSSLVNPWDILGKSNFNTYIKIGEIDPSAADNILIAWPPILEVLNKSFPQSQGIKVLDFGCGTGGFCNRLESIGFNVTGIDTSAEMINTAIHHSPKSIQYLIGNENIVSHASKYDVITTLMTIPFIADMDKTFRSLTSSLKKGGLLFIVDFNREWVRISFKEHLWFTDFDSIDYPRKGLKIFGDLRIPVFIRDSEEYEESARRNNLKNILRISPPFTSEFKSKYPEYKPVDVSEYIILGYKKF